MDFQEAYSNVQDEMKHLQGRHDQHSHGRRGGSGFPAKGYKTIADVENHIKKLGVDCNLQGCTLPIANKYGKQLDLLLHTYPGVKDNLKYFGMPKSSDTLSSKAYAMCSTLLKDGTSRIIINPLFHNRPGILQGSLDQDVKEGWHPQGTNSPEALLTHEFGHAMWFAAETSQESLNGVTHYASDGFGTARATLLLWAKKNEPLEAGESGYVRASKDQRTKTLEAWAEGLSEIHFGKKADLSDYAKEQQKALSVFLPKGKKGWGNSQADWIKNISPRDTSARAKAKEPLQALAKKLGMNNDSYEGWAAIEPTPVASKERKALDEEQDPMIKIKQDIEQLKKEGWTEDPGYIKNIPPDLLDDDKKAIDFETMRKKQKETLSSLLFPKKEQ